LRRALLFSVIFSLAFFGSFHAQAAGDVLIDRVAADFYEHALRHSQSRNIEAATAGIYRNLQPAAQAAFRAERRARWREMDDVERAALKGVKTPAFENLSEAQKAPFRRAAAEKLGLKAGAGLRAGEI